MSSKLLKRTSLLTAGVMLATNTAYAFEVPTEFTSEMINVIYPPVTSQLVFGNTNGWLVKPDTVESNYNLTIDSRLLLEEIQEIDGVLQVSGCWTDDKVQLADDSELLKLLTLSNSESSTTYDGDKLVFEMGKPAEGKKQWFQVKITFLTGDTYSYISPVFNNSTEVLADKVQIEINGGQLENIQGKPGETTKVDIVVGPDEAVDKGFTIESSNEDVVTADEDGTIHFVGNGSANITVSLESSSTVQATVGVNVSDSIVETFKADLNGVEYTDTNKNVIVGNSTLSVTSYNTEGHAVLNDAIIVVKDDDTLSINENGEITAKALGKSTVRVKSKSNNLVYKDIEINVVASLKELKGIELGTYETNHFVGETFDVEVLFNPVDYPVKDIVLGVAEDGVLKHTGTELNEKGNPVATFEVIGEGATECTITTVAQDNSGLTYDAVVTVNATTKVAVTDIAVSQPSVEITKGNQFDISGIVTVNPTGATIKDVTYEVEDDTIASVDETGNVTAIKGGTTNIIVTSKDNPTVSVKIPVNVVVKVDSVTTVGSELVNLVVGDTIDLSTQINVNPVDATSKDVEFTIVDNGVAQLTKEGVVTALKKGETTVTVKSKDDPTKKCQFTINVSDKIIEIDEIKIVGETKLTYKVGDTDNLVSKVVVNPEGYTEQLEWSSNKDSVVKVNEGGQLEAIGVGVAQVTLTGGKHSVTFEVEVSAKEVLVSRIDAVNSSLTLKEGGTLDASQNFTIMPLEATNKGLSYTTEDSKIATVDNKGVITAHSSGKTTLTVKATDGSNVTKTIDLVATKNVVLVDKIEIVGNTTINLDKGDVVDLKDKVVVTPSNATNAGLSWSSDNSSVTVENGVITGASKGTATITVSTTDGSNLEATFTVTVKEEIIPEKITRVEILDNSLNLRVNGRSALKYIIEPSSNTDFTWDSSNNGVASVNSQGVVTANGVGKSTITLETTDGSNLKDSIEVYVDAELTVDVPLNSLVFSQNVVLLDRGSQVSIPSLTLNPANTTVNKDDVVYTIKDQGVATLVGGQIGGLGKGVTTLTAELDGKTAEVTIIVNQPITSFEIVEDTVDVIKGESYNLTYNIEPDEYDGKIVWSSSNTNVSTVTNTGRLVGVTEGSVEITGKTSDGRIVDTVLVHVNPLVIPVNGFDIAQTKLIIAKGMDVPLSWSFTPINTTERDVNWESTNESIASVSSQGVVTANEVGNVIVTGKTINGFTDYLEVEVVEKIDIDGYTPAFIEYVEQEISILKGEQKAINYSVNEDASFKTVLWDSNDDSIATVDNTGLVTGVNQGTTMLEARTYDSTIDLTTLATTSGALSVSMMPRVSHLSYVTTRVISKVSGVNVDKDALELTVGSKKDFGYTIHPLDATNKEVTLTSENTNVVRVEGDQLVGVSSGFTKVWVETADGNFKDSTIVLVKETPRVVEIVAERIDVSNSNIVITEGQKEVINYEVLPLNTTNKEVTFVSDNPSVASVDNLGKVSGIKNGVANITITSVFNPNVKTTVTIVIEKAPVTVVPVTGVSIGVGNLDLEIGDTYRLNYAVYPINASNKDVTFESSDTNVVTVNAVGDIVAKGNGNAKVTVTTKDGGYKAILNVSVTGAVITPDENPNDTPTDKPNDDVVVTPPSSTDDDYYDETITIEQVVNISRLEIENKTVFIREGEDLNLSKGIVVKPVDATNKKLEYTSNNSEVARVNQSGVVTGISVGRTAIEIQSLANKDVLEYIDVIVLPKLNNESLSDLNKEEFKDLLPFTLKATVFDLAKLFNVKPSTMENSIIEVKEGVNPMKVKYKDTKFECLVQGLVIEGSNKEYKDVKKTQWFYDSVSKATQLGYLEGVSDTNYNPKALLNYEDTFTALNRVLVNNGPYNSKTPRTKVEKYIEKLGVDHWSYYHVGSMLTRVTAVTAQRISSVEKFNTKAITRGELATILKEVTDTLTIPATLQAVTYKDLNVVPTDIDYVTRTGLMRGDNKGNFNKDATLTRAELATVLLRLEQILK